MHDNTKSLAAIGEIIIKFVCTMYIVISDSNIREQLLQIKELTFALAVEKALALEASKSDNLFIAHGATQNGHTN